MQTFSALLSGQRAAGATGTRNGSAASSTQDDAGSSGGFDQMLQAQGARSDSRSSAPSPASRMPESSRAAGAQRPRDSGESRPSQDAQQNDSKAPEAKPRDTARTEAKDDAPRDARNAEAPDTENGESTAPVDDTAATTAEPTTPVATDATAPALPEQLLALLNGLAVATAAAPTAAPIAPTDALPAALAPAAAERAATGAQGAITAKPTLPVLPNALPAAPPATPAEGDATAVFALAMGAAVSADGDASTPDATLDTTAIGETTATPLPSLSNATTHPLSRATAAAVMANQPLGVDNGFEDGFGSRIAWLADQKIGHAEIRVTPDHLGTIDVRLQLDGNRVNAEFNSAQAEVRHALESSLPRLRDMLGQQGLQLGHADVGQRQAGQQPGSNGQPAAMAGSDGGDTAANAGWTPGPTARATRGLLDEYA